jgi:DDE superfamily endonuclease
MIPTLRATLGLKGRRPVVGNLDGHDVVYVCGALNLVSGHLCTRIVEHRRASSGERSLQAAFVRHLRALARTYPAVRYPRVVLVIDNAPWHKGALVTTWLKHLPHRELYRLPSYSPQLQVMERFGKLLRRRATHHRLFPAALALKRALRKSLCSYQTLRYRVLSSIQAPNKRTKLSAA